MFIDVSFNGTLYEAFRLKVRKDKVMELIDELEKAVEKKKDGVLIHLLVKKNRVDIFRDIKKSVSKRFYEEFCRQLTLLEDTARYKKDFRTIEQESELGLSWKKRLIGRVWREQLIEDVYFDKFNLIKHFDEDSSEIYTNRVVFSLSDIKSKVKSKREISISEFNSIDWIDETTELDSKAWIKEFDIFKERDFKTKLSILNLINSKEVGYSDILIFCNLKTGVANKMINELLESNYIVLENRKYKIVRSIPSKELIAIYKYLSKKPQDKAHIQRATGFKVDLVNRILDELLEANLIKYSFTSKKFEVKDETNL